MPALSENLELKDDAPRCPRCGKRVTPDADTCAACGYELVPRRTRVRCDHCGRRIPADAAVCPRCGADRSADLARAARPSRGSCLLRVAAIAFAGLLLVCVGWVVFRAVTTNTLARALGLIERTSAPTQVVQVIYVVVTPVPPTATLTSTPTATPTSKFSPTPTRRSARTPTAAPVGFYAAPVLTAPANTTVYSDGVNSIITLQWQPVSPNGLRENEWYYIAITYVARDGTPGLRTGWSKEAHFDVKGEWWNDAASDARMFKWNVSVMRVEGADPLASPNRTPASPSSATRTFFWN
ncbi:MAG: zinc ribbon domain-containing protein [Chloroflexota bacterium]|nr:zinc ribbon domain-containing protein [Chloroflexota bacterium]